MRTPVRICAAAVLVPVLAGCSGAADRELENCVARGVAYFKEIGSYPTLTAPPNVGKSAEEEARVRCARSTKAF